MIHLVRFKRPITRTPSAIQITRMSAASATGRPVLLTVLTEYGIWSKFADRCRDSLRHRGGLEQTLAGRRVVKNPPSRPPTAPWRPLCVVMARLACRKSDG